MDTSTMSFSDEQVAASERVATSSASTDQIEPAPWMTHTMPPPTKMEGKSIHSRPALNSVPLKSYEEVAYARVDSPDLKTLTYDDDGPPTILIVFIPILVVLVTVLLGVSMFLIASSCMKRQRGIRLMEDGGPLDLSKGDGVIGEGGTEGVEQRWSENADPDVQEAYKRAKDWQTQYPPSSVPTDITLSQFLSIQEKGVSAWAFEPDYEENLSSFVQSRTEITFSSDGPGMPVREGGGNSVMANLPLPKVNEVYYWEVKLFEKAPATEVAIGSATKPYPSFRLPGWNKFSVAYFSSDGFKSHNYPFTASSYGPPLAEGDVLGVGYRPRTGTVFFTRNGRKLEDCYTGLNRLNLFPTVGANGPCTLHVNLGQAGFVFIEANVKKWGLAPMVGTLAPPPAYGSERGSILSDAGYGTPGASNSHPNLSGISALSEAARARAAAQMNGGQVARPIPVGTSPPPGSSGSSRRHRRNPSQPVAPSPLRSGEGGPGPSTQRNQAGGTNYVSPTDTPLVAPRVPPADVDIVSDDGYDSATSAASSHRSPHNPPTPNVLDISSHSLRGENYFERSGRTSATTSDSSNRSSAPSAAESRASSGRSSSTARPNIDRVPSYGPPADSPPPPGYAPLDPHMYSQGLPGDLPEDSINQAIAAMSEPERPAAQPSPPRSGGPLNWIRDRVGRSD